MTAQINWGILGTGIIARKFAKALGSSRTGRAIAVGSRTQDAADAFGREMGISKRYPSYDALLADPDVHVIYISTPHPMHAEWTIKAAKAGKRVLCEKPLTVNRREAEDVIEAARAHGVFLMEAFMYRCHPQTTRLVELVRDGAIGEVRMIDATFSFHAPFDLESRLYRRELGGGGILDVGCYCVSMARLIAGASAVRPFAEPIDVKALGHLNDITGIDEYSVAVMSFPGDIVARLSTGVGLAQENVVRIYGTRGSLFVPNPWTPETRSEIILADHAGEPRTISIKPPAGLFNIEADAVGDAILGGLTQCPAMTWDDTLGNMAALDRWRSEIGLTYPQDR